MRTILKVLQVTFAFRVRFSWSSTARAAWRLNYGTLCDPGISSALGFASLVTFTFVILATPVLPTIHWLLVLEAGALFILGNANALAFTNAVSRVAETLDMNLVYWSATGYEVPQKAASGYARYLVSQPYNEHLVEKLRRFHEDCTNLGLI